MKTTPSCTFHDESTVLNSQRDGGLDGFRGKWFADGDATEGSGFIELKTVLHNRQSGNEGLQLCRFRQQTPKLSF